MKQNIQNSSHETKGCVLCRGIGSSQQTSTSQDSYRPLQPLNADKIFSFCSSNKARYQSEQIKFLQWKELFGESCDSRKWSSFEINKGEHVAKECWALSVCLDLWVCLLSSWLQFVWTSFGALTFLSTCSHDEAASIRLFVCLCLSCSCFSFSCREVCLILSSSFLLFNYPSPHTHTHDQRLCVCVCLCPCWVFS